MLTPDLLRQLKSLTKNCQMIVEQTISDTLLTKAKDIDLRSLILESMRQDLANSLLEKANLIEGPVNYNSYSRQYKAIVWGFSNEELEDLLTKVYEAGLNAKDIL